MSFDAIIFDFDGVLIESEYYGNRHLAEALTELGHPTDVDAVIAHFMGLSGDDFHAAIERWIGRPIPPAFHALREAENARVLAAGVPAVAGAIAFVEALPPMLPRAVASSSTTRWIETHLAHIGLARYFAGRIFSGREHVARGKPAPDLYLFAARALGVAIERVLVIEDSPIGVTGAVASGATVVGLCAGRHCALGHDDRLRALGAHHVAASFDDIARLISR